jgi:ubiquinone/menaquinone biosynthesis C-methylase UbiE
MLPPMPADKFPKRNYEPRPRRSTGDGRPAHGDARPPRGDGRPRREYGDARPPRDEERLRRRREERPAPAAETAWEPQAGWYDQRQGERGDDFHSQLVLPAALRQMQARPGQRVLDVCCGQGVLGRALAEAGMEVVGVDASPSLVAAATARAGHRERYVVGDVRTLDAVLPGQRFDHAAVVLALQDLDPIEPVFAGIRALVKPGGRIVVVLTHPCFRIPKRTSWGWDEQFGVQYRRLEGYMTPLVLPIRTHPGQVNDTSSTSSFHRPLHHYLNALGAAGLAVVGCEELCSHRRGTQGARSGAEDRAAKEFPVFLVLTATRLWRRTMRD